MASPGRPRAEDVLTPSEWEVVHMVRHGMTNRRIAQQRGTTLDGVKFHLENIRAKLTQSILVCVSGREKAARGEQEDVALATELNASACVPILKDGAYYGEARQTL